MVAIRTSGRIGRSLAAKIGAVFLVVLGFFFVSFRFVADAIRPSRTESVLTFLGPSVAQADYSAYGIGGSGEDNSGDMACGGMCTGGTGGGDSSGGSSGGDSGCDGGGP